MAEGAGRRQRRWPWPARAALVVVAAAVAAVLVVPEAGAGHGRRSAQGPGRTGAALRRDGGGDGGGALRGAGRGGSRPREALCGRRLSGWTLLDVCNIPKIHQNKSRAKNIFKIIFRH